MLYYTSFTTHLCPIILVGNQKGIHMLHLETGEGKRKFTIKNEWQRDDVIFREAKQQIDAYCHGELHDFTLPILPAGTDFQQKVWKELTNIPYGEIYTYGQVAEKIGNKKGSRAVGTANGKNPIPLLIPCHRVIGANGSLAGFAHGLTIKKKLIDFEAEHRK